MKKFKMLTPGNKVCISLKTLFETLHNGDILIEVNPGWHLQNEDTGEDRMPQASATPFPIILYGTNIEAGQVTTPVTTDRIAPTLSRAIRIRAPNACTAEPLF